MRPTNVRPHIARNVHAWRADGAGDCTHEFANGAACYYPERHPIHTPADAPTRVDGAGESEADRIDAAIVAHLDAGNPTISANDVRDVLDEITDRNLIGKRFSAARASGVLLWIRGVDGTTPSTPGSTKGHEIKVYRPGPIYQRKGTQ